MNTQAIRFLLGATIMALSLFASSMPMHAAPSAVGNTYLVNSTLDEPDADPAQPVCASTPSGLCTLRAAIMRALHAPGPNTIVVPSGVYLLTRPGYSTDALTGSLDIANDVTIEGSGSGATIIDGNGGVTKDRVFRILPTAANITLAGLEIRNGQSFSNTLGVIGGGGLYMEGAGQLHLRDVIFAGNGGQNGGGLYANFSPQGGSLELDHVVVHGNTAAAGGVGAGGGMFAYLPSSQSQVVIRDSRVDGNTADGTGGGLFVEGNTTAQWSISRSEVLSNTAASGGGIGNFVPLTLSDSRLQGNHAAFDGGAMEAFSPFAIARTTIDQNTSLRFGGAIFDLQTGALGPNQEFAHIEASTLSRNSAHLGGGIYHDGFIEPSSLLTLLNSTLSGNVVYHPGGATGGSDGGGLYVYDGQAQLFNATIADNRVAIGFPRPSPGIGGGLYITATATLIAQNSLIAGNVRGNGLTPDVPDDCFSSGTTGTLAFDLIYEHANCFVSGPQGGNIFGQAPLLSSLQPNGGPTLTHALLAGSPAIDAGGVTGCTGAGGAPITTDQRGFMRPYPAGGRCDIGAYERGTFEYLPVIGK